MMSGLPSIFNYDDFNWETIAKLLSVLTFALELTKTLDSFNYCYMLDDIDQSSFVAPALLVLLLYVI